MLKNAILLFSMLLICFGCRQKFFDEYKNLTTKNCTQIIIKNADNTNADIIIDKAESIDNFIVAINEAKKTGPWKGTAWGKIKFIYPDTIIELGTFIKVFKSPITGKFYKMNDKLLPYFN